MNEHFAYVKDVVLDMGQKTLIAVDRSITAMLLKDPEAANTARGIEKEIDAMLLTINEYCLETLANQTFSRPHINFLVTSLKISIELERICDYANQIAKIEQKKLSKQNTDILDSLKGAVAAMQDQTLQMLKLALHCYDRLDDHFIKTILEMDRAVDKKRRELFREMLCLGSLNPWSQEVVMDFHTVVRYIERVADRATNIAELVYYIIHGKTIK